MISRDPAVANGIKGPAGPTGPTGPTGNTGITVTGPTAPVDTTVLWGDTSTSGTAVVPLGGSTDQVLAKTSGTDYATTWVDPTPVGGLVYITSQTIGTGVSGVTVTGAFSSTYDSYKVVLSGSSASVNGGQVRFQLTGQGTSSYGSFYYDQYTGTTGYIRSTAADFTPITMTNGSNSTSSEVTVYTPFLTQRTSISGTYGGEWSGYFGSINIQNASFTGFTLLLSSGTLTGGTIAVFGFRK